MNALKIVQNASLHCHSRPDECGEQQKYGEKRTKEAHKSSIMLNPNQYGSDGSKTQNALEVSWRQLETAQSYGASPSMLGKPSTIFVEIE